jgi:hypothetical protein
MSAAHLVPGDLVDVHAVELAAALVRLEGAVLEARHGVGPARSRTERAVDALDALAHGAALAGRAHRYRWLYVLDAVRAGAVLDEVAAAGAVTVPEVRAGVASWLLAQVDAGAMSRATAEEAAGLIERANGR